MAIDNANVALVAAQARLSEVQSRIRSACQSAGRDPRDVRLVAVSKRHPAAAIRVLYGLGQREFGENYVQELGDKLDELQDLPDLRMRCIGHVQRNKVKRVVGFRCAVDTIDSLAHARAFSDRAVELGCQVEGLLQVNVGREPQKAGLLPEALPELLAAAGALPGLRIRGLMTLPPATAEPQERAPYFAELADLARVHGLAELSMGMSDDLEVAIAHGATMVRIGTALFGARPPTNGPA